MIQQFHALVFIQRKLKTLVRKQVCTSIFIVALFTTAEI